jgi:hypothetical protein
VQSFLFISLNSKLTLRFIQQLPAIQLKTAAKVAIMKPSAPVAINNELNVTSLF